MTTNILYPNTHDHSTYPYLCRNVIHFDRIDLMAKIGLLGLWEMLMYVGRWVAYIVRGKIVPSGPVDAFILNTIQYRSMFKVNLEYHISLYANEESWIGNHFIKN